MSARGAAFGPVVRITAETPDCEAVIDAAISVADETTVVSVGPTGAPSPLCPCTLGGTTAFHVTPTPETVMDLVETLESGVVPTEEAEWVVNHDPETGTLPTPETGPLSVGDRRVLGPCGWADPSEVPDNPVADIDPDAALERLSEAGLRGRGRGDGARDKPLATVLERALAAEGDPIVVIHAADIDAPADELLTRGAAGMILDAAAAVAEIVDATDLIAFASAPAREALEEADSTVIVREAPESFDVGEPTMAIEALEGSDRIEARRRPPGPEEWGLYGRPTVVNTPRTLLQVRELLTGGDVNVSQSDPGTRLVTVRGAVAAPATVELPTDRALAAALRAVETEGTRYVVGGRFGGLTRSLEVPASASALSAAGLGTEGVVSVLAEDDCVVATVGERAAFAREENCGRCVPCREGSKQLHESLRAVYDGEFDDDTLRTLARTMESTSLCVFGKAAARPVRTALEAFEPTFRAHAEGHCPAGSCEGL